MANAVLYPGSICSRLVDAGIITEAQAQEALEIQKTSKALIGSILTQLGYCTEDDIARTMAQKSGYRYVSINEIGVNVAAANLITPEMALRNNVLPLYQEDKTLYVAMKNPNDIITIDNLHLMTGLEICPLVVADMELAAAIENFANMNSSVENYDDDDQTEAVEETEELTLDDKPAVQLVNQIINNAIKSGASDVHIEALEKNLRVRFRIDGVLQEVMQNPIKIFPSVVSRVKVLGGMDIAEKRVPQDGRATVRYEDKTLDVRIATMPTVYGEKIVMRLLERNKGNVSIKDINFSKRQSAHSKRMLSRWKTRSNVEWPASTRCK